MKVNVNQMNAIPFLLFSVVVSGSLGGYVGYQGYPQPIPAPYFPFPYNVAPGPAPPAFAPAPPANLPQHYYSPPGNTYRGFSYETDYPNGGSSQVVFVTGPQSRQLMQRSFESFRQIKPIQAKLRLLTVTPAPEINLQVVTEMPTLETNSTPATTTVDLESISVFNPTPAPTPNSVPLPLPNAVFTGNPTASVYRVQVFPSHIPQYTQYPHFLQAPFPYHPIFTQFYNAVPQPNVTGNNLPMQENTNNGPIQQESANDGQESMISEVGTLPAIISNRIDSPTSAPAGEPASTAQTLSTATSLEALSTSPELVATASVQESSSTEAVATSAPESSSIEAVATSAPESSSIEAVATSAPESSSIEAVATSAPESSSIEAVATSAPESASIEAVATSAPESSSIEAVATSAPESSSIEAVTTSASESSSVESGTTQAQESSSIEAVTSEAVEVASRIQVEVSTDAAEVTTSENTPSMGGDVVSETAETTSTASVSEDNIMPTAAATMEPSGDLGMVEQTTAEQTTEA